MKQSQRIIIGLIIGLTILVSACASAPVVDDLGEEVVLSGPAQKIISLSPSTTEILFAVGAGGRVIGRDSNSLYPEDALAVLDLGGMWDGVPVEDILALEPDLILTGENISPDTVKQLQDVGLTVYWQSNPKDFPGLFENIRDVAGLTGNLADAEALIKSIQERIDFIEAVLEDVEDTPLVFYELDATDPTNPFTAGTGTFISYVISQAKGRNLGDALDNEWVQISSEELIKQNPDYILLADAFFGVTTDSVKERAGWADIKAVTSGNVIPFDPYILSIPGPRLVDGLEEVTRIIHPGLLNE